jgi:hypothetical protein
MRVNLDDACFPGSHSGLAGGVPDPAEMVGVLVYPFVLGIIKVAREADRDTLSRLTVDDVDHLNGYLHALRFHLNISRRYRVYIAPC